MKPLFFSVAACFAPGVVPCVIFEDEHLLVVNKPPGWNTHAPAPHAGEGIFDWLRHREPRWAGLVIIHRLDKETSGVLVFSKTPLASKSLTEQFAARRVRKTYLLATDRLVKQRDFVKTSRLARTGERYASVKIGGELAETHFRVVPEVGGRGVYAASTTVAEPTLKRHECRDLELTWLAAEPRTGRTHQIRVQAAEGGFPILGDSLYGGGSAKRVFLHAAELTLEHPASGERLTFRAPPDFAADSRQMLREAIVDPGETDAFRLCHGAADGRPGWFVDQLGPWLCIQSEQGLTAAEEADFVALGGGWTKGIYHKLLNRQVRRATPETAAPRLVSGEAAPAGFGVRENGLRFELDFNAGYSVGLFLDQRDNRHRLLTGHVAADFPLWGAPASGAGQKSALARGQIHDAGASQTCPGGFVDSMREGGAGEGPGARQVLNLFAYTCAFSVCAAAAGARTVSVDLSRKYLDWGRRNFALNALEVTQHEFLHGDAFDWLKRLAKRGRRFGAVLLDPPTFSASRQTGVFQAERHYGRLVTAALPVLVEDGVLFASTNAAGWSAPEFLAVLHEAIRATGRRVRQEHYCPQPPDFPVTRAEPAHLKTVWLRVR